MPQTALGAPDCHLQSEPHYVSLGVGGNIVIKFVDNVLTGSGDSSDDLWVFEIGPAAEDTFVDISTDGSHWIRVGTALGGGMGWTLMPSDSAPIAGSVTYA